MTAAELADAHWRTQTQGALLLACPHVTNAADDLHRWHLVVFHRPHDPEKRLYYVACDSCERRMR